VWFVGLPGVMRSIWICHLVCGSESLQMARSSTKNLSVSYGADRATEQVHRGNIMVAATTSTPPSVHFSTEADELYTVLMVTPDGVRGEGGEVFAHWIV
jgi:phosphatidylethanolamine-binding protein (PEBP) family uncharacterized protein